MRWILVSLLVISACDKSSTHGDAPVTGDSCRYRDHDYAVGETWSAGDNCNDCTCETSGHYTCTARPCQAPADADPATLCQPNSTCASGPGCGSSCCAQGEQCVNNTCMCGSQPACTAGNTCEAAGPVGGDACGGVCCGANGPCPQ